MTGLLQPSMIHRYECAFRSDYPESKAPGSGGMLSSQDTNAMPARFYRVGVSLP